MAPSTLCSTNPLFTCPSNRAPRSEDSLGLRADTRASPFPELWILIKALSFLLDRHSSAATAQWTPPMYLIPGSYLIELHGRDGVVSMSMGRGPNPLNLFEQRQAPRGEQAHAN